MALALNLDSVAMITPLFWCCIPGIQDLLNSKPMLLIPSQRPNELAFIAEKLLGR